MSVSLPLVLVLGAIALFGYSLSQTFLDSTIDDGTRNGVEIVNGTDD